MDSSTWPVAKLIDVVNAVTVGHVGPMAAEYRPSGIPFLRSQNVKPFAIDRTDIKYINEDFHRKINKSRLTPGDVVIVRTGTPGTAAVVPEWFPESNCADLVIVRPSNQVLPEYIAYYINGVAQHHIDSRLVGAVQQHFNVGSAKALPIPIPTLDEQRVIVGTLGQLDDKIELNRRMNQTLEATARAIFRSWFVDFDPVIAKAEGRQPAHMSPHSAALFPDHFEDTAQGSIPAGWTIKPIGDAVRCVGGGTPRTGESKYWEGGKHPFATPRDMSKLTSPVMLDTERHITDAGVAKISSGQLPVGTVLLSSRAPIGYLTIAMVPLSVNQGIIAMICDRDLSNHYVLHWTDENMEEILSRAGGTTFAEISKQNFRPIPAIVPAEPVQKKFNAIVGPIHDRIAANVKESQALAAIRDTLLPKLLSGEIRLHDVEVAIEEVA